MALQTITIYPSDLVGGYGTTSDVTYHTMRIRQEENVLPNGQHISSTATYTIHGYIKRTDNARITAADLDTYRRALMRPRGKIVVKDAAGTTMLTVDSTHASNVANWGPTPRSIEINGIIGDYIAPFTWVVEEEKKHMESSGVSPIVLGITRNFAFTVDENALTMRTVFGSLRVRRYRDGTTNLSPDRYRYLCVPSLPENFRRCTMQFKQSEDALSLEYAVIDQEVRSTFPYPVISGHVSFTANVENVGGLGRYILAGSYTVPRGLSKVAAFEKAVLLRDNKFPPKWPCEVQSVTEDVYSGRIDFQFVSLPLVVGPNSGMFVDRKESRALVPPNYGTSGISAPELVGEPYDAENGRLPTSLKDAEKQDTTLTTQAGTGALAGALAGSISGASSVLISRITGAASGVLSGVIAGGSAASAFLNQEHIRAPYVAVEEHTGTYLCAGTVQHTPKYSGGNAIVQQVSFPKILGVSVGIRERVFTEDKDAPKAPDVVAQDTDNILHAEVQMSGPVPLSDGKSKKQSVSWCVQTVQMLSNATDGLFGKTVGVKTDDARIKRAVTVKPLTVKKGKSFASITGGK